MRVFRPAWFFAGVIACACAGTAAENSVPVTELPDGLYAEFKTPAGTITAELYFSLVPLTVANFVGLAEATIPFANRPAGKPFYDGLTFHRVVPDFVAQGGDPVGTGEGGPGYRFQDEFTPRLRNDAAGTLAMANARPNDNGCQFFFLLSPVNRLNYKHTVFGRVVRGLDALPRIREGDTIEKVTILRRGAAAEAFRPDAATFARLRDTTPVIAPRDPDVPSLFANPARMPLPAWYPGWLSQRLHHYAAVTGITLRVQIVPRFSAPPDTAATRNPLRHLHNQLAGNDPQAATLVFVAEERRWRLWLGDALLARFQLPPEPDTDSTPRNLDALKQAILADAKRRWDAGELPNNIVDAATTGVIEALDRPDLLQVPPL